MEPPCNEDALYSQLEDVTQELLRNSVRLEHTQGTKLTTKNKNKKKQVVACYVISVCVCVLVWEPL